MPVKDPGFRQNHPDISFLRKERATSTHCQSDYGNDWGESQTICRLDGGQFFEELLLWTIVYPVRHWIAR